MNKLLHETKFSKSHKFLDRSSLLEAKTAPGTHSAHTGSLRNWLEFQNHIYVSL